MNIQELARSYTSLTRAILKYPKAPWEDALSHGQMQSKAWAVDELAKVRKKLGTVYILAGWIGTLAPILYADSRLKIDKIRSFDIDPSCQPVADCLNVEHLIFEWHYKAVTKDIFDIDYETHSYEIEVPGGYFADPKTKATLHNTPEDKWPKDRIFIPNTPASVVESPDTLINTSCDHIKDFAKWWRKIPKGTFVLLQNNNFEGGGDDHVNTVTSLEQFADQAPMTKIYFSDKRDCGKYIRYMLIGQR